ncbi:MAG: DUF3108 domain-containing protein [Proteobacteria bacterium]|nr:DUF3108 domain-containing protein [Pseudomonadota bacterium]MBU1610799.1 DUF3108 domain-containing protein [Pseudomonadota bacterium]
MNTRKPYLLSIAVPRVSSALRLGLVTLLTLAALLLFSVLTAHAGLRRDYPFAAGEKLTYDIYWTVVHAGQATLEVLPDEEVKGEAARHFHATARTSEFVDNFYKVRDTLDSWTDPAVDRTLKFHQVQREGTYKKDTIFDMDWPGKNLDLYGIQGFKGSLPLDGPVLDSLSALYAFRTHPLFADRVVENQVTDGKKIVLGRTSVVGRETIETDLGEFDCFRAEVDTKDIGGVFKKSPGASVIIWFTADERRLPIRVKSKVSVGHFSLELVRVESVAEVAGL